MKTTTFKALISESNEYGIKGITIPRIQRSYAQGRNDAHAAKTRHRFLSAIQDGLAGKGLTLDFIYGNIDQYERLIPLDGQQRLTTLWLLHWYAAKKENIKVDNLDRFTYNTRYSARDFIAKLVTFQPSFSIPLNEEIKNQGWFPMDWDNDPTVSSMLTMLDEIQLRFCDIPNLWNALDLINFYFRNIDEMKLTDDIYIKMNSRGKLLTDFEHFKAEFLKVIRSENGNEAMAKRIGLKIDREWTDLIWTYRDESSLVDNGFLRFFRFISLILIYKSDCSASEFDMTDDFGLLDRLYKNHATNIEFLEKAFDLLYEIHCRSLEQTPDSAYPVGQFFQHYLSPSDYQPGKTVVPQQITETDILKAILENAALRRNTTYWVAIFYTFLLYLMYQDTISDVEFRRRLRVVINLLKNSRNEVVDNPNGDAGNRIPAILQQLESIILTGTIAETIIINGEQRQNFNVVQMDEERKKLQFTAAYPEHAGSLFRLEDFHLLEGRVDVIGYENTHLYSRFLSLFTSCSYDAVDCAMLSIADYSQRLNWWCIQLGSGSCEAAGNKAWHSLFHPTGKTLGYANTKKALRTLLDTDSIINDDYLNLISDNFIAECRANNQYDWRYYYIKYPCFRPDCFGKYTMYENQPYSMVALVTEKRESSNAFQCMLLALIEDQSVANSSEWYDNRKLTYKKGLLSCEENAFVSYTLNDYRERERFVIPQNDNNIDTVDRIQYFKEHRKDKDYWISPES